MIDGIGDAARDENFAALARRGHWISLGQASGALQPISADRLVAEVDHLLAPGRCSTTSRRPADLAERAPSASGSALADGTLRLPPIERHALDAADAGASRGSNRARTIGALVLIA